MLPTGIAILKVNDDWAEIRGWTKEPFVLTSASALQSIRRTVERKATTDPERYQRNLDLYLGVMEQMGWGLPEDLKQVIDPVVPVPVVTAEALAVEQVIAPVVEPPIQIEAMCESLSQPELAPELVPEPRQSTAGTWLDEALAAGDIPDPVIV